MSDNYAIIVAAGEGRRLPGAVVKQFRPLGDKPLLAWTLAAFEQAACIDAVILVVAEGDLTYAREAIVERCGSGKVREIIAGGPTRFDSVILGLRAVPNTANLVFIHDGARPLIHPDEIKRVGDVAEIAQAAILAIPQAETLKRVEGDFIIGTLDRSRIWVAQTPQVFKYDVIISAYLQAMEQEREFTDDAAVCEAFGISVRIVAGQHTNPKVTTPEDLDLARSLLAGDTPGE